MSEHVTRAEALVLLRIRSARDIGAALVAIPGGWHYSLHNGDDREARATLLPPSQRGNGGLPDRLVNERGLANGHGADILDALKDAVAFVLRHAPPADGLPDLPDEAPAEYVVAGNSACLLAEAARRYADDLRLDEQEDTLLDDPDGAARNGENARLLETLAADLAAVGGAAPEAGADGPDAPGLRM